MAVATTDIVSHIAELSDSAFAAFCEDIGEMFGVDMECERRQAQVMAACNLREHFKKLAAVHTMKADGALKGTFHLVFDQAGLFVLSGVIVMLPESRILEDAQRGSLEDAMNLQDAAREVGNLLVGSWDRVFRGDCPGHEHFNKTSTFLGKPWDKPEQSELQADTEVVAVLYEMTLDSYPSFTCAAVFPRAVLSGLAEPESPREQSKPEETESSGAADPAQATSTQPARASTEKPAEPVASEGLAAGTADDPSAPEATVKLASAEDSTRAANPPWQEPGPVAAPPEDGASPTPPPSTRGDPFIRPAPRDLLIEAGMLPSDLASTKSGGTACRSDFSFLDAAYIQSRPQAGLAEFLNVTAGAIMEKDVVWAGPEDTVQDVVAKMQQNNVGYVLIGVNGALEGLVSGSNILGAVSLYLRPMFAKWRRPQDDATLGVKVKWIMSRPVRTVRPDATLAAMIESMRRCGGRCLPVVDAQGAVLGLVTVFDILMRILQADESITWQGKPPQAPALLI